jgi:hypothetical protein
MKITQLQIYLEYYCLALKWKQEADRHRKNSKQKADKYNQFCSAAQYISR